MKRLQTPLERVRAYLEYRAQYEQGVSVIAGVPFSPLYVRDIEWLVAELEEKRHA